MKLIPRINATKQISLKHMHQVPCGEGISLAGFGAEIIWNKKNIKSFRTYLKANLGFMDFKGDSKASEMSNSKL